MKTDVSPHDDLVRPLAWLTLAGIALYFILTVTAQLLPPHYSPIHQAESDLAVGPYGYLMTIAFVVRGLLSFALLVALARGLAVNAKSRGGLIFLGIWAAGALLLAMFPTDVTSGRHTMHGGIHLIVAAVAFVSVAIAEFRISARLGVSNWSTTTQTVVRYLSYLTAFTLIIFFVLNRRPRVFGLFERLFLGSALFWMLVVAIALIVSVDQTRDARQEVT